MSGYWTQDNVISTLDWLLNKATQDSLYLRIFKSQKLVRKFYKQLRKASHPHVTLDTLGDEELEYFSRKHEQMLYEYQYKHYHIRRGNFVIHLYKTEEIKRGLDKLLNNTELPANLLHFLCATFCDGVDIPEHQALLTFQQEQNKESP